MEQKPKTTVKYSTYSMFGDLAIFTFYPQPPSSSRGWLGIDDQMIKGREPSLFLPSRFFLSHLRGEDGDDNAYFSLSPKHSPFSSSLYSDPSSSKDVKPDENLDDPKKGSHRTETNLTPHPFLPSPDTGIPLMWVYLPTYVRSDVGFWTWRCTMHGAPMREGEEIREISVSA